MDGASHWASTVGAGVAPEGRGEGIAVGERGEWPWELVLWRRHLKEPAWVAGAHTHFGAAPPATPGPQEEEFEEKLRRTTPRGDGDGDGAWWWLWWLS